MLVPNFEEFSKQALELCQISPDKFRFNYCYRHDGGSLRLRATDDIIKIELETDQIQDLKKAEKLNRIFFFAMQGVPVPPEPVKTVENPSTTTNNKQNVDSNTKDGSTKKNKASDAKTNNATSNKKKNKKGKK